MEKETKKPSSLFSRQDIRERVNALYGASPLSAQILALRCAARVFPIIVHGNHSLSKKIDAPKNIQSIETCLYINSLFLYAKVKKEASLDENTLKKEIRAAAYDAYANATTAAAYANAAYAYHLYQEQFETDCKYLEESKTDPERIKLLHRSLWDDIENFKQSWSFILNNFEKKLKELDLQTSFDFYQKVLKEGFDSERIQNYLYKAIRYPELVNRSDNDDKEKTSDHHQKTALRKTQSNTPSIEDKLGFKNYVEGMVDFLEKAEDFPLTFSVEGSWGSGKSSFMAQLRNELEESETDKKKNFTTIWYNPWKNDKEEALWASFILDFKRQIAQKSIWWQRIRNWFVLKWRMIRWTIIRTIIVPELLLWSILIFVFFFLFKKVDVNLFDYLKMNKLEKWEEWGTLIGALVGLLLKLTDSLKRIPSIFQSNLNRFFNEKNYEERLCALENTHRDFAFITRHYAGNKKIAVFIDDLDRCAVPKAAELLQAIQLILSSSVEDYKAHKKEQSAPKLIFILGIDREKVAAGVTVKYEKLLSYLFAKEEYKNSSEEEINRKGLCFGHEFIEKFIDVPFRLPKPCKETCIHLVTEKKSPPKSSDTVTEKKQKSPKKTENNITGTSQTTDQDPSNDRAAEPLPSDPQPTKEKEQEEKKLFEASIDYDSDLMQEMIPMTAELLDNNPRRVKHFVNLFRLYAWIHRRHFNRKDFTLQQLAKVIALSLIHPQLFKELEEKPSLLKEIKRHFNNEETTDKKTTLAWTEKEDVKAIFRYAPKTASTEAGNIYDLEAFNTEKLFYCNPTH